MSKPRGFTLIELLVVIAIIAMLLAILMPALNIAKRKAQGVVCLANLNGLSKGWYIYSIDNDGRIVGGSTPNDPTNSFDWTGSPQDENGNPKTDKNVGSEIDEKIIGIRRGLLYPYIKNPESYHCPGDKRMGKIPVHPDYNKGKGGYRTYSITGGMNGVNPNGGWGIIPIVKHSQIRSADSKYVFLEEMDGRGYNMGSWVIRPVTQEWVDPIGIWHKDASTLGFADGHAEFHKWHGAGTIKMAEEQTFYYKPVSEADLTDFLFMQRGYAYHKLE